MLVSRAASGNTGTMPTTQTPHWAALAVALILGCAGIVAFDTGRATATPNAGTARALNVTDNAQLHLTTTSGSLLVEEGSASGKLPGTLKARFRFAASVTASFTIYPRGGGSITGSGAATLHSSTTYSSFAGTIKITSGTGRYKHANGTAGLYGTYNRRTYALTVQTTGTLRY